MEEIYKIRNKGLEHELWSPYTRCIKCGDAWLYGVTDNLNFLCPKCIRTTAIKVEPEKLSVTCKCHE